MTVPSGSCSNGSDSGCVKLAEKARDVEWQRRQPLEHVPFPHFAGTVPVDLDAVPVGVAEVDRLAHEVV